MKPPEILITGLGHCGSTFVARLFQVAGYDLGKPLDLNGDGNPPRKGLEWIPLIRIIEELQERCFISSPSLPFPIANFQRMDEAAGILARIEDMEFPQVVKSCHPGIWLALPYMRPRHIIVVHRALADWVGSMHTNEAIRRHMLPEQLLSVGAYQLGMIFNAGIEARSVLDGRSRDDPAMSGKFSVVCYPAIAESEEYALGVLGDLMPKFATEELRSIWRRSVREEWIGFSQKNNLVPDRWQLSKMLPRPGVSRETPAEGPF